ncbi:Peroxisomal membrane protein-like protein [Emericellopsis cladophorae]|uniref:Peroxisomal membrane protein-like protein n=1 Tax=Emericellopsis cladophorae TaxID=2686198 RepID=A0A9P9Y0M6_9HYPO|nr:Peroxisomal membrane protein-like protein [Emericellopsis cladophorae]KAI6781013.1 Peroxisomal membrane protein-like protein [Emericellopsis cladophorae]
MSSLFEIREHVLPTSHIREFARATSHTQTDTLVQHVKQYIPTDNSSPQKGDITIIGAHANGFPKELYEPLWDDLHHALRAQGINIRSIIIADAAWQGQSGVLNAANLGNDPSWNDLANDLRHLINILRPPPPLFAIGHSLGAAALTALSLNGAPRLFTGMILMEPVIQQYASSPGPPQQSPAAMSSRRRDTWPDRQTAMVGFRKSPFYAAWDDRVLDRWGRFGLRDSDDGRGVALTTTKHQEVFTFLRPAWPAYDAGGDKILKPELVPDIDHRVDPDTGYKFTYPLYRPEPPAILARLPHLRPPVLYVFGLQSPMSPEVLRDEKMRLTGTGIGGSGGQRAGMVKKAERDNGHLIPLEAPGYCAQEASAWVTEQMQRWWAREREYEDWTRLPQKDKSTLSAEHLKMLGVREKAKI